MPGIDTRPYRHRLTLGIPLALLCCLVGLFGCSLGRDYRSPDATLPAAWRGSPAEQVSLGNLPWWRLFGDEVLQEMVWTALEANADVRLAAARVEEARALLGVARAQRFPELNLGGRLDSLRKSERSFPAFGAGTDVTKDVYGTSLDLSFELDLWGRLRRANEAARAELLAGAEARQVVASTLISSVAQGYFALLGLDRELEIARATLRSRQESLYLVWLREHEGWSSELDRRRAEAEVAATAALIPELERGIAQIENGLSVLLGRNPGPLRRGPSLDLQFALPTVPAGLPSDLLDRRPDIRQAEQQLVAANARIGEARAAYFPRIALTGLVGVESVALSDLFTSPARVWQFGPSVSLPVFNAGKTRARVQAAEARHVQALLTYQQTVRQAFREVEDALVAHRKAREVAVEREALVQASRRALTLVRRRYEGGLSSYLEVLDVQRQLLAAELDQARTRRDQLVALVQVYKALGGGWSVEPSDRLQWERERMPGSNPSGVEVESGFPGQSSNADGS